MYSALYVKNGWLGRWLVPLGIEAAYTRLAIVLVLVFVGLPFVVRTVQPILEDLDPECEEASDHRSEQPAHEPHYQEHDNERACVVSLYLRWPTAGIRAVTHATAQHSPDAVRHQRHRADERREQRHEAHVEVLDVSHLMRDHCLQLIAATDGEQPFRYRDVRVFGVEASREGVADDKILSMMQGMIKQRNESIALYEKGNRADLADKEKAEIAVIERFLPQQMDEAAVQAAVNEAIAAAGAKSIKDMGGVMAALKTRYAGQMDFAKASAVVKKTLAG